MGVKVAVIAGAGVLVRAGRGARVGEGIMVGTTVGEGGRGVREAVGALQPTRLNINKTTRMI